MKLWGAVAPPWSSGEQFLQLGVLVEMWGEIPTPWRCGEQLHPHGAVGSSSSVWVSPWRCEEQFHPHGDVGSSLSPMELWGAAPPAGCPHGAVTVTGGDKPLASVGVPHGQQCQERRQQNPWMWFWRRYQTPGAAGWRCPSPGAASTVPNVTAGDSQGRDLFQGGSSREPERHRDLFQVGSSSRWARIRSQRGTGTCSRWDPPSGGLGSGVREAQGPVPGGILPQVGSDQESERHRALFQVGSSLRWAGIRN
ncbi:uncharacterized protein LOC127060819 isoform X2 [Serinus canaria]|uniref:uncharacterized protein LOC127060819 isoform X2 n=1 Tax=Serinus canaria TaxID=9135 RepID=UPI0021CC64AE|nr:uncharacterized protein LOC127060819 isoform X2 [Serinus canaria]